MYRNKKDVDKHVESLLYKLTPKDFKTRAYSIARLYYEVGDYRSCQKYVEQYLTQKTNNAAAYKLLGQAFQKLGDKEKALEQFKTSLDIDPTQSSTILDICELLADEKVEMEIGRAKYWCEKAEATYPKHPITFRIKERLLLEASPKSEDLENLLRTELESRPKDVLLHTKLLKCYLQNNKLQEAIDYSSKIEFTKNYFNKNLAWYEALSEILKFRKLNLNDWLYQLLLLTVKERLCLLSLSDIPTGMSKNLVECNELLHTYDQAIESVSRAGASPGFGEFHANLLQHHQGQLAFHTATFILKKAEKDQLNWHDAVTYTAPLMLIAWQTNPVNPNTNWLMHAPEKQQKAAHQWHLEGSYRCSQSGHYLLTNNQEKSQIILDKISQFCSGTGWKDKLYEKIFSLRDHLAKIESSHFVSNSFKSPAMRFPRKVEVQAYDDDAQRVYPNSLHHFVWTLSNYKNFADYKCTLFDMLPSSIAMCSPETLNKLDMLAFLYSATLTMKNQKKKGFVSKDRPVLIPANITNLLCTLPQIKFWDCAYKLCQNELGSEHTDIRSTITRGIETVRCIDNHGLDSELLCHLGKIFSEKANMTTKAEDKINLETRASLYYSSAINILEKIKSKIFIKTPGTGMFAYTHDEFDSKQLNNLLEESKLYVAISFINEGEHEKVIDLLSNLKSPQALYYLSQTYKNMAIEEKRLSNDDNNTKYMTLLDKAKQLALKALHKLKQTDAYSSNNLYADIQVLIENIETFSSKVEVDTSPNRLCDNVSKYSSDENVSEYSDVPARSNCNIFRNNSSTPKQTTRNIINTTNYRTATDSQIFENTQIDLRFADRIENQIKSLQKRDGTINDFMEQTKEWFAENRKLGNQIISTINTNIEQTTEQFKLLKVSVDQVKDQIDECRNECKDVADLKKQIAELKKEVNKLKRPSEQTTDESELYNLEEEYRTNESTSNFGQQLPFTPQQIMPHFAQRFIPPFTVPSNPYQLYGQNFYNLYNQYTQFPPPSVVPGAQPIFDPTRTQMNYPGVYPNQDQMYLDVAHLVPPTIPVVPTAQNIPSSINSLPTVAPTQAPSSTLSKISMELKETPKSLPVNVVITSSDPLPTYTLAPAPVLSVTIPTKHIKGTPHNYQIAMPSTSDTNVVKPPPYSFASPVSQPISTVGTTLINWNQTSIFATSQVENTMTTSSAPKNLNNSVNVVDGIYPTSSPNTSLNKSRTLSERSNTSIENYDPCPDFKPIVPLPAEIKVTTGEENETAIFSARAKLYRFVEKQWKERGIGEMKLLKHKITGRVRVLMRREQVHKICANHIILPEMEIKPMKNETKAYFWVANDFAEETVILEKFCIRFKTADIAKDFYEAFEKSRLESITQALSSYAPVSKSDFKNINNLTQPTGGNKLHENQTSISVIGGFTFNSTPVFKPVVDKDQHHTNATNPPAKVESVFSGLTFKTSNSSLQNIFNIKSENSDSNCITQEKNNEKSCPSDLVDEFIPTAEFKPVVPLPALVDQKTGEEDELILFEHRAKLLRFDAAGKEWKERGLGNIKLLVHKDNNNKVRLLMRREQIMKICCNHTLTKEMTFQKMPNMDKAVTWCAKDFSDGELVAETFCLRFKTVQLCNDFIDIIKIAQSKIGNGEKAAKEEQNAAKLVASKETLKLHDSTNANIKPTSSWGDKFKPKSGTWECNNCLIFNEPNRDICNACMSPRIPPAKNVENANSSDSTDTKIKFGVSNLSTPKEPKTVSVTMSWGDKFKPKEGSWECNQCLVRNEANIKNCRACNYLRYSTDQVSNTVPKFKFGIPQNTNNSQKDIGASDISIFNAGTAEKFRFGIPQSNQSPQIQASTNTSPSVISVTKDFGINNKPLEFSVEKKTDENNKLTSNKPPLLPTPKVALAFGETQSGKFDFSFTPKPPSKGKSPIKTQKKDKGDDSDDNEYVSEDEGHHIHFSPVIPMPDKVDVVTGEEDELELYSHRAKLYRFTSGEWKERGLGIVKILKHRNTEKLRVIMRREQVHKICLNHALTPDVMYKPKDEKTWLFVANDFSEGELLLQKFCLRFNNKDIAEQFKEAIDAALNETDNSKESNDNIKKKSISEDVEFVSEVQATMEEKQRAKNLMLPENFFTYVNKDPCQGCRGCEDDTDTNSIENQKLNTTNAGPLSKFISPNNSTISAFSSPSTSLYGTPNRSEKTIDMTLFRTPLSTMVSNTKPSFSISSTFIENESIDKENTLTDTTNNASLLRSGETSKNKISILATPKLGHLVKNDSVEAKTLGSTEIKSISGVSKPEEQKSVGSEKTSVFGIKSVFGDNKPTIGDNKSIFSANKSIFEDSKQVFGENKPVFGENKPVFGENKTAFGENKPVFGENKPVFGENKPVFGENKPVFGETKSIFGENKSIFGENKPGFDTNTPLFGKNKTIFGENNSLSDIKPVFSENKSIFGESRSVFGDNKPVFGESKPQFSMTGISSNQSIFEFKEQSGNDSEISSESGTSFTNNGGNPTSGIWAKPFTFSGFTQQNQSDAKSLFSSLAANPSITILAGKPNEVTKVAAEIKISAHSEVKPTESASDEPVLKGDDNLLFTTLSGTKPGFEIQKKSDFNWEGAGQPLFRSAQSGPTGEPVAEVADEEYDPHYEPIVPLPDEIVVTTGEEDEQKLFGERCKLYRFDEKTRDWKERGVGEMKILYHPERKSYRMLLRREQVHKAVLNMLISMDLELLPSKNSDRAWTWAGRNYADAAGEQETLAVRFKTVKLATAFYDQIQDCVRKLQVAAAEAIRNEKEAAEKNYAPLRLPKHLEDNARVDGTMAAVASSSIPKHFSAQESGDKQNSNSDPNKQTDDNQSDNDEKPEEEQEYGYEHEEEIYDYEHDDDSDGYYNEEDEELTYYMGKAVIKVGDDEISCEDSHVEVAFDQQLCSAKILVTDANTGEILSDMLLQMDTEFQMSENTCTWTGIDYTSNIPFNKTVTVTFADPKTAIEFYDTIEINKAATCVSLDQES